MLPPPASLRPACQVRAGREGAPRSSGTSWGAVNDGKQAMGDVANCIQVIREVTGGIRMAGDVVGGIQVEGLDSRWLVKWLAR